MIRPGKNIAIKVPLHKWSETVEFYRGKIGLKEKSATPDTVAFEFGAITLWIDRVPHQSQSDVWLELFSDEPAKALDHLGAPRRDELEPLTGVEGHWTSDPCGVILLVQRNDAVEPLGSGVCVKTWRSDPPLHAT